MFGRTRKKRRRPTERPQPMLWRQLLIGISLTTFLALLITGVWHVTRLPAFTLTSVQVIGGVTIPADQIQALTNAELTGYYYRLIPKRFSYLYPKDMIIEKVQALERVKNATVARTSRYAIAVVFEEYEPYALWCVDRASKECLFIDRHGYAFTAAPLLSGGAFLRFTVPDVTPTIGQSVVAAELVRGSQTFVETTYDQLGLNIVAVTVDADDIAYYIAGGGEIRTSASMAYTQTLSNLESILGSEEFSHLAPGNFAYIDLRFGDKVFVHEGVEEVATTTVEVELSVDSDTSE